MADASSDAPERRLDALIGKQEAQSPRADASGPAYRIDPMDTRDWSPEMGNEALAGLTRTDALRLGRVIRALADAGLIDECFVFVTLTPVGLIASGSFESRVVGLTYEPTHGAAGQSVEGATR